MKICLQSVLRGLQGWGNVQGCEVRRELSALISSSPMASVIQIDFSGIEKIDVPFAREALVELARSERGQRGICLINVGDQDLLDNVDGAALFLQQPLMVWTKDAPPCVLGPQPSVGLRDLLTFVLSVSVTTTNEVAAALHLGIPNASNKLATLFREGYILRQERSSSSGGREYLYMRIA